LDLNGPAHVFYEAKEYGAAVQLHFTSIKSGVEQVQSSAGLNFTGLTNYKSIALNSGDYIIVPGLTFSLFSTPKFLSECKSFNVWLYKQFKRNVNICSICTGAFILAEAGVLDNKLCTTHWKRVEELTKKYPKVNVVENKLFVTDENVSTSAGVSSGIDLSLAILEKEFGIKMAIDVAKEIVIHFRRTGANEQINAFLQHRDHLNSRVHEAQKYIADHLAVNVKIQDIAFQLDMSERNLTRLFKKNTGVSIGFYKEVLRVQKACELLSENRTVNNVTESCGLKSANQLRTLLKKHGKSLPSKLKNKMAKF